jgi:hypothetical protein
MLKVSQQISVIAGPYTYIPTIFSKLKIRRKKLIFFGAYGTVENKK